MKVIGSAQPDETGEGVLVRLTKREYQFLVRIQDAVKGSTWDTVATLGGGYIYEVQSIDHPLEAIATWCEAKYAANQLRRLVDRLDKSLGIQESAAPSPDAPMISTTPASPINENGTGG